MNYRKIIIKPVITEKSLMLIKKENKYVFLVSRLATKGQIKEAIEDLFGVTVKSVNVLKNRGKLKRSLVGTRKQYRKSDSKKAVVQLAEKDSIKFFEGGK